MSQAQMAYYTFDLNDAEQPNVKDIPVCKFRKDNIYHQKIIWLIDYLIVQMPLLSCCLSDPYFLVSFN